MKNLLTCNFVNRNNSQTKAPHVMMFSGLLFITLCLLLSGCGPGSQQNDQSEDTSTEQQAEQEEDRTATAKMEAASGSKVTGEAMFTDQDGKVRFELTVENLTPGEHAVHLREKGDCSAEDASSAGGHWNPTMKPHGKRGDGTSYHKGDIGNMNVGDDGKGTMNVTVDGWSIRSEEHTSELQS